MLLASTGRRSPLPSRVALILPACHEEETIGPVLDELQARLGSEAEWIVAVGVNGSPAGEDRTGARGRRPPAPPAVAVAIPFDAIGLSLGPGAGTRTPAPAIDTYGAGAVTDASEPTRPTVAFGPAAK